MMEGATEDFRQTILYYRDANNVKAGLLYSTVDVLLAL
jgi:hypothetical protein